MKIGCYLDARLAVMAVIINPQDPKEHETYCLCAKCAIEFRKNMEKGLKPFVRFDIIKQPIS